MIYIIIGGIGSGKTLSAVRQIINSPKNKAFTNFRLKNFKNYHRLKFSDIIKENVVETKGKPKVTYSVNWEYWDKVRESQQNFSIFIDEIHNVIHARRSMENKNILMSKWVSQIRKILQDKEHNHLVIISQTMSKIDKDFRDLAGLVIECELKQMTKKGVKHVIVIQHVYKSVAHYEANQRLMKTWFLGNQYFKYYNSLDMIRFGDAEEFV